MFEPDVREILIGLLTRSQAGEVKWLESEAAGMRETAREDYVVLMPNSSINVFIDFKDNPRVNFIDSAGDTLLSLTADTDDEKALVKQLIESAKKSVDAPKVFQTLDDIKKALKQDGVIGETNPRWFKEAF